MALQPRKSSRKVNIAVMSASVNEHQRQLQFHLQRPISNFFHKLYQEGTKKVSSDEKGTCEDLLLFQEQLKLVPNWNQRTLSDIVDLLLKWIRNKHFRVIQSIKTVVVGRTMLLVAMGNADSEVDDRVRVDIPDQYSFIHDTLSHVAHELYTYPSLMRRNPRDTEVELRSKNVSINDIIRKAIENTITDKLSSPAVFAYLHNAMNVDSFDGDNSAGVDDDDDDDGDDDDDDVDGSENDDVDVDGGENDDVDVDGGENDVDGDGDENDVDGDDNDDVDVDGENDDENSPNCVDGLDELGFSINTSESTATSPSEPLVVTTAVPAVAKVADTFD
jgi:hypothetical protein